ncbi:GNAT family N-acetyltransferase [bacterium]|nr:GNAT family N-acetyltransferase [bacterium]
METFAAEYPKVVRCRNHLSVLIKPLELAHVDDLVTMLRALPSDQQALLPCDVNDPDYADKVRQQIDDESVYRLVAWHGNQRILGSLAMYPGSSRWVQHTARLVQVTHPDFRRAGIATVLLEEVLSLAEQHGILKVYAELTDMHKEGCKLVKDIGFRREAVLEDHMRDDNARFHKLIIYSLDVATASLLVTERLFRYVRMDYKA